MLVQIEKAILHWLIFGDIVHLIIKLGSSNPKSEEFWKLSEEKQNDALCEFCKPYKNSAKMKIDWFIQDYLWMIPKPILRYLLKRKE